MEKGKEIFSAAGVDQLVARLAAEVAAALDLDNLVLFGIRRRGVELAARLREMLATGGRDIPFGILDITLYRDDLSTVGVQPVVSDTRVPCDLAGRDILLVDDVLYTGRTVRSALSELLDFGRPRTVKLLVLIDRNHRELPIQPDFTGAFTPVEAGQFVEVHLREVDGADRVLLVTKTGPVPGRNA